MRRAFLYLFFIVLSVGSISTGGVLRAISPEAESMPVTAMSRQLYEEMRLDRWICFDAFMRGLKGSGKIERKNKDILTLIDFSKPSTAERLVVLDIRQKRILYTSLVSHGKNSGENYATSFSNENGSHKSSLGFYLTENTYEGRNGYSLILNGLEKGINDLAKQRAIVIHGASYSNPSVAAASGRLGRSFGCPALPLSISKPIINTIKDGTLLFIYANDKSYLTQSPILSTQHEKENFLVKSHQKVL
ncbi:murein L,D-transpeptidase catalytic domain family protein [uncultured Parabacteroides sp.]|uniref:murein L,D-transpeptidase catalytic domain family protein n=1 Tax=uncultured Parabacteroides sp. TaxID=512312 RepID=UPI00260FA6F3|nr:murein L,D-transpeptidase catalytic domain family protein [uncultured Parabacteroides sp.]